MQKCFIAAWLVLSSLLASANETTTKEVVMESDTPQYLYKILSLRHWQASQNHPVLVLSADDHAFIHFSKEDQLERILTKYWADAPQFAVLKIDTSKLVGDMVYEANPGGSAKYYHLYNGYIPFKAIVESKITYRSTPEAPPKLEIVKIGDSVLRKMARELSVEEILSPEIQHLIEEMKATMRSELAVGLAAPQIGKSLQIVVIEDMDHSHLTLQQLTERNRFKVPLHVIINPRIHLNQVNIAEFFEGCLSIPHFLGIVPRAASVRVECLNERAEPIVIQAEGWYARILQHEIDHLNGTLFVDRAHPSTLMTEESYAKFWKEKSIQEVQEHLMLKDYSQKGG